ncbi:MAG: hypothetical protein ACK4WI_22625 [Microcystis sp.]
MEISKKNKKSEFAYFIREIFINISLYLGIFLFLYADFVKSGVGLEERGVALRNVPTGISIMAISVICGAAFYFDKDFRRLLFGKLGIIYLAVLFIYTLIGWQLFGNDIYFVKNDLLIFLYLIYGLGLFRLIVKSHYAKLNLMILTISVCLLLYNYIWQAALRLGVNEAGLSIRAIDWEAVNFLPLAMILIGIGIGVFHRAGLIWAIIIWGLVLLMVYSLVFLGATRSAALVLLNVVITSALTLFYRVSSGIITPPSSSLLLRHLTSIFLLIAAFIIIVVFSDFIFDIVAFFQNTLIYERFFTDDASNSNEERISEAIVGIESLQDIEWLFGRGIGANYWSPVGVGYQAFSFHIGIFTFLLKGGLPLFLLCVYFLYIKFPQLYIKALLRPYAFDDRNRTALLIVLPSIFAWAVILLIYGGFIVSSFIGLGISLGAYLHIKKYGLNF